MPVDIVLTTIQVLPARPEAADLRKIRHYAAQRGTALAEVSYIIKLYTQSPPVYNSLGVELYVGNQQIRQYAQFKNGIYFKLNDPQQLAALQGQEVRFRRPGAGDFMNTGVRFPAGETINRHVRAADMSQLPTQAELLQE
jgi:hypothetical protein